ncbi:MAG TPA: HNH endonuclease [candidate division Zixibacteria bacterium]|nr:HNH endonuclease [candidate division Zixibacteria bacterium]
MGITDWDWFRFLRARQPLEEVNFWQPSAGRRPVNLDRGALFLFKLHAADGGHIVGGGFFIRYTPLPVHLAWEAFGEENGAATFAEMVQRIGRYRRASVDAFTDLIGCTVLVQPFFFDEAEWIPAPSDWAPNIVQGKTYDSEIGIGRELWLRVQSAMAASVQASAAAHAIAEDRYGPPILVQPRLGQGAFRVEVLDAYGRRCAITGERTLPVLDAAHIKPYALSGPHRLENGLLLRKDLHALFDAGYVTVTPSLKLRVSRRIREEYENGRDYYALDGAALRPPAPPNPPPSREFLEWHADTVFRS